MLPKRLFHVLQHALSRLCRPDAAPTCAHLRNDVGLNPLPVVAHVSPLVLAWLH